MTSRRASVGIVVCLAAGLALSGAARPTGAGQWPRFRGPNGAGLSDARGLPITWAPAQQNWRVKLPGVGHSSPVVWGRKVFLTCSDQRTGRRSVVCLDVADGRVLWRRDFADKRHRQHRDNCFASASPALDAHGVYVTWATPGRVTLLALDHAGRDRWRRDLGPLVSMHGNGTSPIVFDGLVVLGNDQKGKAFLLAVEAATGRTRWQVERRSGLTPASTPCIHRPPNGPARILFTTTAHGITAIDPATGKTAWEVPKVFRDRCVGSPISAGHLAVASYGYGITGDLLVAARGPADGRPGKGEVLWQIKKSVPLVPTPVAVGKDLFLWRDNGEVTCVELATGKVIWRQRVKGQFYGSPVCVAGRLYCISRKGEVVVLAAARQFKLLGRTPLGETSFATPAVADGVMYLRTYKHLISVGGKRP